MPPMLAGLLLGLLLVFPGLEFIKFLGGKVTGLYPGMTLTEACLAMVVILLSIIALRGMRQGPALDLRGRRVIFPPPIATPPRPPRRRRPATARPRPARPDAEPDAPPRRPRPSRPAPRTRLARSVPDDDTPPPSRRAPRTTDRDRRTSRKPRR